MNFFLPMKKFKLVVILFLLLFAQRGYCEHNNGAQNFSSKNFGGDELSFKTTEFFFYNLGDLPSAQIFFSNTGRTSNLSPENQKSRDFFIELFNSKTKVNLNLALQIGSIFSRYSSAFQQIYLNIACFRL